MNHITFDDENNHCKRTPEMTNSDRVSRIRRIRTILTAGLVLLLTGSCVTNKKTTYLQQQEYSTIADNTYVPDHYRVVPNDNLYIRVITPDPKFSDMFNTVPVASATMSVDGQAVELLSYPVQADGTIDIPYLGKIYVSGKTLPEIKRLLETSLSDYVSDAAITVKLVNNYVSILGEVRTPGKFPIYKEQMNIFHAIAMAGDLSEYGNRTKVKLVRELPDTTIVKEFDLTDQNIIYSEYFHVMPNDVIYVQSMKGKFFSMSQFPFALILSSITTFVLVMNYVQTQ